MLKYVYREYAYVLAAIGCGRSKSYAVALLANLLDNKTLTVVLNLDGLANIAVLVEKLYLHILDESLGKVNLGEVEGTVVEGSLSIHKAVRADGLTVEV